MRHRRTWVWNQGQCNSRKKVPGITCQVMPGLTPQRLTLKFHLGFPSGSIADLKMPDNAALAELCEALGFDTLWHSNERFYREMFVRMTSSAMVTSRIGIGGAIAEPFAIHPALTAQLLATVDELAGGRQTAALGRGFARSVSSDQRSPRRPGSDPGG